MAMTISEKILANTCGKEKVVPGEIIQAKVDKAMMDDILGPRVEIAEKLEELDVSIWDPEKVTIISDHYTPPANQMQANIVKFTREWSAKNNVAHYYEFAGPCHQVMVEEGRVLPGELVVGTDSHTCTYGALGAFSTGIGSTEMLGVLVTGEIWLKVPQSIKITCNGRLPQGVYAKDLILKVIGDIGHAGATYKALEFDGSTISDMIMDERLCITNMAVEAGAKNGIIAVDDITCEFMKENNIPEGIKYTSDADAQYCNTYKYDAKRLVPYVACPHEVDNVKPVSEVGSVAINQAYIGSCTGGRYNDLFEAAQMLRGRKIAKNIRLLVSPASRKTWEKCDKAGILGTLSEAGATILAASCGACLGVHSGVIGEGEVCISSTNRNFIGRMGSKKSNIYLGSPVSVTAAAIAGRIIDPREI
ncbi:MAG: 3-isopropylmalate dehydratase large subunit [Lentihominibacter sp.]